MKHLNPKLNIIKIMQLRLRKQYTTKINASFNLLDLI
jgi:hypothetical protein